MQVAVFVGTRADLGPLESVLKALIHQPHMDLHVLCGVAFNENDLRTHLQQIDRTASWQILELCDPLTAFSPSHMLAHGPKLAQGMARLIETERPDALVVLGDRWELLFVVPPAYLADVPVVHLHGGEVTEGALDERVRHAITKLADVHCVASADARTRVLQMGEPPDRVIETGAPGLDRLTGTPRLSVEELSEDLGAPLVRPVALFTYHPPTAVGDTQLAAWAAGALRATLAHCASVVVTHPGMDAGREVVLEALEQMAAEDDRVVLIDALGARFPSVLASVDVVVGNSSSGIIEAASLGIPVVDIGLRQAGRLRGANVLEAPEGHDGVLLALQTALTEEFREMCTSVVNPYGDGRAADRIVKALQQAHGFLRSKRFVDCERQL